MQTKLEGGTLKWDFWPIPRFDTDSVDLNS